MPLFPTLASTFMSDRDHPHDHAHPPEAPAAEPVRAEDSGSQALSEALRSSFAIVRVIMVILVIVFFASGIIAIGPQELGIKLRFGKPVGVGDKALLSPGLHWAFPYPIDEVIRVPIGRVQTITSTVGWYATTAAQEAAGTEPPPGPSLNPETDGYVITADGNIIHVRATLNYRISDPLRYVFGFANGSNLVQNALNNALLFASAHFKVDSALTRELTAYKEMIRSRLEQVINQHQLGITVDQVDAVPIPPRQLREDFAAVIRAETTRGTVLNEARTYANETVARANGESAVRISAGQSDRVRLVATVSEEAKRFKSLLPAYERDPDFFANQLQLETVKRILTNAQQKFFLPQGADGKLRELRILLNRELQRPTTFQPPQATDRH
jgi:membrane protease subunit HflK